MNKNNIKHIVTYL